MSKISRNDPCPCGSGKKYKQCCLAREQQSGAFDQLERESRQKSLPGLIEQGIACYHHGDVAQSRQIFEAVLQINPDDPDALHLLGVIARDEGQYQQGILLISRAIKVLPKEANFYNNLGICYRQSGDLAKACESYEKAVALKPDHVQALNNLGNLYSDRRMFSKARQSLKRAIALNPAFADAHFNLGSVLQSEEALEEALQSYQQALAIRPDYVEALSNCGMVLHQLDREDEALACFEMAIRYQADFAPAYANLGALAMKKDLSAEALPFLLHANQLEPDNPNTLNNLAQAEKNLGLFADAVEHSAQAFNLAPTALAGLESAIRLAILCYLQDDKAGARHWLMRSSAITRSGDRPAHAYWTLIGLLLSWQERHADLYTSRPKTDEDVLYVIGESHALSLHGLQFAYRGQNRRGHTLWVEGCKQWHLGQLETNGYQQQFERYLSGVGPQHAVLVCVGEIDCRINEGIFKVWQADPSRKLSELIAETVGGFVAYLTRLQTQYQRQISICGVPASNNMQLGELDVETQASFLGMIHQFNQQLQAAAQQAGLGFLDVFALTDISATGKANGDWHLDRIHLRPDAYVEAFAQYHRHPG
ncbi:tetratricopeptide repeat protein [Chitinibacter sp. FCG-7]|uniref:Tetratricopeptide repeat protein n=1 Tax=Chitinibacter mangrovi TaxID=3153927 RepID=A0AAU7F7N6_9NEIS